MKNFKGTLTALITPFYKGQVDYDSLASLIDFQSALGVNGFVINGTTAESPTLTLSEVKDIFKFVKSKVASTVPLILGTGSNSTQKTMEMTQVAESLGADAALVVVPYYNKPPQRGLVLHYASVAQSTKLPIFLYNVPGRTVTSLSVDTIAQLSEVENIIGIKEASGNIKFLKEIKQRVKEDFILLSGDDGSYDDFMKEGGHGVISVASHFIKAKDFKNNLDLINMLFCEANPIPVKKALQLKEIIKSSECRLPLVDMDPKLSGQLLQLMKEKGYL